MLYMFLYRAEFAKNYGVKSSVLMRLPYFNAINFGPPDAMHLLANVMKQVIMMRRSCIRRRILLRFNEYKHSDLVSLRIHAR